MCEYCREKGKREDILDDEDIRVKIKKEKVLGFSIRIEMKFSQKYSAYATSINYCPMCGRKLGDR